MWGALLYGGQLLIPSENDVTDPDRIYQLIVEHKVTVFNQTPSVFMRFIGRMYLHASD